MFRDKKYGECDLAIPIQPFSILLEAQNPLLPSSQVLDISHFFFGKPFTTECHFIIYYDCLLI